MIKFDLLYYAKNITSNKIFFFRKNLVVTWDLSLRFFLVYLAHKYGLSHPIKYEFSLEVAIYTKAWNYSKLKVNSSGISHILIDPTKFSFTEFCISESSETNYGPFPNITLKNKT